MTMQPLSSWPLEDRVRILGVLTDVDDTLTTHSHITQDALDAMAALKAAGLHVIPITGRPAGWSEPFATTWPVDAIVAETGAVALLRGPAAADQAPTLQKWYLQDEASRQNHYTRMQEVAQRILREVPGAQLAQDSAGRETDIAIDHSEATTLSQEGIDHTVRILLECGMTATVSSIHVNGWYGHHDKWIGARWIVRELLGRDLSQEMDRWVFIGDSLNDQVMFQHFPQSVGVANIARFQPRLKFLPRYVTSSARGAGFAEMTQALLAVHH